MKKQLIIATTLVVASTSVWASRARMMALGQDADRGSQYISDSRNVFRNAAMINGMKDFVVAEGAQSEGGLFRSKGKLSYGVYFNRSEGIGEIGAASSFVSGADDASGAAPTVGGSDASSLDFFCWWWTWVICGERDFTM